MRRITASELPILKNLFIKRLVLAPGSIREPHWHANANELVYCLSGSVLISILDNGNDFSYFTVEAGEMFHIKSGALHCIENVGGVDAEFIICVSS
jgi:oxalate decarboxylase